MRRVENIENGIGRDVHDIKKAVNTLKWLLGILITVFFGIAAILAYAANIV